MTKTATTQVCGSRSSKVRFQPEHEFDRKRMRHYLNGAVSVLHCHHYATLFTQLAIDAQNLNGPKLLAEASAETFYSTLSNYFKKHNVTAIPDRLAIAEQYYTFCGMGQLQVECQDKEAVVTMRHSHVDEGWMKKWGQRDQRVNFIGEGFVQAVCAAVFDLKNPNAVKVTESQSIVSGASTSRFTANW